MLNIIYNNGIISSLKKCDKYFIFIFSSIFKFVCFKICLGVKIQIIFIFKCILK